MATRPPPQRVRVYLDPEMATPEWLTCAICQEEMKEPSQLRSACTHAFCEGCLVSWLSSGEERGCPTCRAVPDRDVGASASVSTVVLPSLPLRRMLEEVKVHCRFGLREGQGGEWIAGDGDGFCSLLLRPDDMDGHESCCAHGTEAKLDAGEDKMKAWVARQISGALAAARREWGVDESERALRECSALREEVAGMRSELDAAEEAREALEAELDACWQRSRSTEGRLRSQVKRMTEELARLEAGWRENEGVGAVRACTEAKLGAATRKALEAAGGGEQQEGGGALVPPALPPKARVLPLVVRYHPVGNDISLVVEPSDTIAILKSKIFSACADIPVDRMQVRMASGRVLQNQRTIGNYGLEGGDVLGVREVAPRPRVSRRIYVKTSARVPVAVDVDDSDSIIDIKSRVQAKLGGAVAPCPLLLSPPRLFFGGRVLLDLYTIAEADIHDGALLVLCP